MKATFILLLLISYGVLKAQKLSLNYLNPSSYTIDSIEVIGNKHLNTRVLIALTGLQAGDKIRLPGPETSEAIKKLWRQGIINDAQITARHSEKEGLILSIEVRERPRLTSFSLSGVRGTEKQELLEKLQLNKGNIITEVILQRIHNTVRTFFQKKGFLQVKTAITEKADTDLKGGARLHILVKKGPKIRVRQFNIIGQSLFAQAPLKRKFEGIGEQLRFTLPTRLLLEAYTFLRQPIKTYRAFDTLMSQDLRLLRKNYFHEHAYLNLLKSRKFDQKKYSEGKAKLVEFLHKKGYRSAHIAQDTLQVHGKFIDLTLQLYTGNIYYIRNISWTGNYLYTDEQLSKILGLKKGDIYNPERLDKQLNFNPLGADVSSLYLDDGYLFFNVQPIEISVAQDSIDIEMRVYEGKQATIARIIIKGNERTREHVIRRELTTLPGQKFSRSNILRSQQYLAQLPFIDAQGTKPIPIPRPSEEVVDIEWQITEKSGDQIELSAGWGAGVGFVGSLGFTLTNFSLQDVLHLKRWRPLPMGNGQRLGIRYRSNGRVFNSLSLSFTEPWLGGKNRNNFSIGFDLSEERFFDTRDTQIGSFGVYGISTSLTRSLKWPDNYFSWGNYLNYRIYVLDNAGNRGLGFETGRSNALSLTTVFTRNNLDDLNFPRHGSYLSISSELTPPYSLFREESLLDAPNEEQYEWIEYYKINFDAKTYMEIVKNMVLESRVHIGAIGKYSSKGVDTPFERFTLGGNGQNGQNFILGTDIIGLRGYPNNSIEPRNIDDNLSGGKYFGKAVLELRYLAARLPAGTIYVLGFWESGNSWNNFENVSLYNMYRSAGLGLRLNMPGIGLVGIDWGRAYDTLPGRNTPTREIHFSIGNTTR